MEYYYSISRYVSPEERDQIATLLNLSPTNVKVWFQNRRMKERKSKSEQASKQASIRKETCTSSENSISNEVCNSSELSPASGYSTSTTEESLQLTNFTSEWPRIVNSQNQVQSSVNRIQPPLVAPQNNFYGTIEPQTDTVQHLTNNERFEEDLNTHLSLNYPTPEYHYDSNPPIMSNYVSSTNDIDWNDNDFEYLQ
ncbi:unnamed protein product [Diatraea saccharalis]|uniref:Homeobox domain-containing protein n=1 Tax=Diatraea saccharalis TaxID=40085 RepID=A0A9N9WCD1_9NEOP|nr:unnamed protein product [Diatraea saccharalis]